MAISHSVTWQDATVAETSTVAERIRRITLRPEVPRPVRPGEHVKVLVDIDGSSATRSYSVVDAADDGSEMSLSVFHTPHSRGGSSYMHSLRAGDRLRVSAPLQDFPLRIGAPDYILVAGGIGITAIRGMASLLRRLGADYVIHYSARSPEAMAYRDELRSEHGDRLHCYLDSDGEFLDIPGLVAAATPGTELYMCGPIRLMDAIRRAWGASDLDPTNLRFETFGNSGWYAPEPFSVTIPRLGVSATIGENESILEALEGIGIPMMSSCRRGECGLCQVTILETQGQVDHRDVFFSDSQKATSTRMCACVSRLVSDTPSHPPAAGDGARISIDVP
ncbi:PDR/VanB family oxidoreductase [Corynebacterium kalidii]|uniref:PDR/VanB family oxidoreductase n=1 Tax=Corynebacterium kalidii TaxID=2931982 RepID=A0A9X2AY62_9CORY|nr:PDR/VanB family oxidoreductase [Corynebacterium kalidii]MCJ7857263.1 PDR/VanB family oxidoreductase [Corynebacterium kalidii]